MGWKSGSEELAGNHIRHICLWRDERRSSLSNATLQMAVDAGENLELLVNSLPRSEVVALRNVLFDPKDGIIALVDSTRENLFTADSVADALRFRLLRLSVSHWRWTSSPATPLQAKNVIESAWSIYKRDRKSSIRVEAIALISALLLPSGSSYFAKDGTGDPSLLPFAERVCSGLRDEIQHGIVWNSSSQNLASSVYRLIGGLIWSFGHDLVGSHTAMLAKEFLEASTENAEGLDSPDYKAARAEGALYGLSGVLRFVDADYARLIATSVVPIIRAILASASGTRYGLKKAVLSLLTTSAEVFVDELTKEAHAGELSTGSASTLDSVSGVTIGVSNGRAIVRSIICSCEHQNYELRSQSFKTLRAVSRELGAWFEAAPDARRIHPLYRELVNEVSRLLSVETQSDMDASSIRAMRISVCILENMARTIAKLSGEETTRRFLRKLLQTHNFTTLLTREADIWGTDGLYSRQERLGDYSVQLLSGIGALLSAIKGKADDAEVAMRIDQTLASVLSDLTTLEEKKRKEHYFSTSKLCVVLWDRGEGPLRQSLEQLVYASLTRTTDSQVEDVVELRRMKVFQGLWQSLIGSRPDRSDSGSIAPLQRFLFGKLVTSIWNSLNELSLENWGSSDLEAEWDGDGRSATQPNTLQTVYLLRRIVKCSSVLLEVAEHGLLQEWAPNLLKESSDLLLSHIYQAEFYVLMKAALAACRRVRFLADTSNALVKDVISAVLESTASSLLSQRQDTLVSIVEMVLEVPAIWSRTRTDVVVKCICSALELGTVREVAAQRAMDAIEELLNQDQTFFNHFMKAVILRLLPFVRDDWNQTSSELTSSTDRSVNGDWRSLPSHRAVLIIGMMGVDAIQYAKELISEPFDLETSFDSGWLDVPETYFQYSDAEGRVLGLPITGVGGSVPLLFSNSFQSKKLFPHIHTILLLPSLSEMVVSSNHEQRLTACELVHAVTVKLVAESSKLDNSAKERKCTTEVFKRLFPMLVKLACDRDDLVRDIFRPLVLQLVHYYSSSTEPSPPDRSILVEALVEGATSAVKATASTTFGSLDLLAEYIRWSLKHLGEQGVQRPSHAIDELIYRILALLRDPDEGKRVATISLLLECRSAFDEYPFALAGNMFQLSKATLESLILYHMPQKDVVGSKVYKARRLNRYLTRLIGSELPSSRADDESGRVAARYEEHLDWLFKNVFSSSCTGPVREELMWSLHHLLECEKREMYWLSQRLAYMRAATADLAARVAGGSSTEQNNALVHVARLVRWMLLSVMKTRADSAFEEPEDLDEILFASVSIISGALANGSVLRDDALRAVLEVCHVVARSFMSVEPLSSLVDSTMSILIAYLLNKEALPIAESRRKSKFVRGPVRDLLREVLVKKPVVRKKLMEAFDREVLSRRSRLTLAEEMDPDLELARSIFQGEGLQLPDHVLGRTTHDRAEPRGHSQRCISYEGNSSIVLVG
uniref:DNA-dependent protein kinase catalytic subunit CC1/2 domain-containing protein n=1 Tax=Rhodosorus marinus TaxID=101924 RepID=A0A7S2ZR43_9RHOD|mmetsp:Transcript_2798/g.12660  ORF Transcript_2798/g.12660 Transcript_2798/m.12660 type:complete len:1459 (+) Transcript_2798:263-4639(+)